MADNRDPDRMWIAACLLFVASLLFFIIAAFARDPYRLNLIAGGLNWLAGFLWLVRLKPYSVASARSPVVMKVALRFECAAEGWQHHRSVRWGSCRRMIEVAEDQMALRQVEIYRSGQVLVYDRAHPRDEYGMLMGLRFSKKDKWRKSFRDVRMLTAEEFETEWKKACAAVADRPGG